MASTCLVTGANGFIGSHLVEYLQERGDEPRAMVRQTSNLDNLAATNVEFRYAGLNDIDALSAAMEGVDIVYHVAGVTAAFETQTLHEVNARGSANVFAAARAAKDGPRRVVYVSSLEAAGQSHPERARAEHHTPQPFTHYGRSKFAGEQAAWDAASSDTAAINAAVASSGAAASKTAAASNDGSTARAVEIVIVRPPLVYGPRDQDVLQMIQSANWRLVATPLGCNGWISAIHCHDLVRGIVLAAERGKPIPSRQVPPATSTPASPDPRDHSKHVLEGGGQDSAKAPDELSHAIGEGIYFFNDGGRYTIESFGHAAAAALGKRAFTLPMPRPAIWLAAVAAELAGRVVGKAAALNRDKVTATFATGWWCDASKARDELGFKAEMPLEKGLPHTIAWLRENKIL